MPDPNPIEETLNKIEIGIRQLKLQYDMFFSGVVPRQPFEVRKEFEILLKTMANTPMQRFADRYRFNSLAAKYQTMVELWGKMTRAKEEGRLRPGIPGFVEPVRRGAAATDRAGRSAARRPRRAGADANGGPSEMFQSRVSDPATEAESLRVFYDRFVEAKRMTGGADAGQVSYNSFVKQIAARTQAIKAKAGCDAVTYSIVMKEGAVTLKAVPAGRGVERGKRR